VTVDVTVDPDVSLFDIRECLEQLFNVENLRVEFHIRIDPLTIHVNACDRVPIVTANDTIWVQNWNEDKCVEFA